MKPITSRVVFKSRLTKELGFVESNIWRGSGHTVKMYRKPLVTSDGLEGYETLTFDSGNGILLIDPGVCLKEPLEHWSGLVAQADMPNDKLPKGVFDSLTVKILEHSDQIKDYEQNLEKYTQAKHAIETLEKNGNFIDQLKEVLTGYQYAQHVKTEIINSMRRYLPQFKNILDEFDQRDYIEFYTDPDRGKTTVQLISFHPKEATSIYVGKARLHEGKLVSKNDWMWKYFYGRFRAFHSGDLDPYKERGMFWDVKDLPLAIEQLANHYDGTKKLVPLGTLDLYTEEEAKKRRHLFS